MCSCDVALLNPATPELVVIVHEVLSHPPLPRKNDHVRVTTQVRLVTHMADIHALRHIAPFAVRSMFELHSIPAQRHNYYANLLVSLNRLAVISRARYKLCWIQQTLVGCHFWWGHSLSPVPG